MLNWLVWMSLLIAFNAHAGPQCAGVFQRLAMPSNAHAAQAFWNENLDRFDLLPALNVIGVHPVVNDGELNRGTFLARLDQREVFLKIPQKMIGAKEAFQLIALNRLGLGVKFLGVVKMGRSFAIAMEKLEGVNTKEIRDSRVLTPAVILEMQRQVDVLTAAGFTNWDLQFMISPSGRVTMIDAEYLKAKP